MPSVTPDSLPPDGCEEHPSSVTPVGRHGLPRVPNGHTEPLGISGAPRDRPGRAFRARAALAAKRKLSHKRHDDRHGAHSTCFCARLTVIPLEEEPGLGPEVLGLGPVTVTKLCHDWRVLKRKQTTALRWLGR